MPAAPTSFAAPVDLGPGPNPVYDAFQQANGDQVLPAFVGGIVGVSVPRVTNAVVGAYLNGDTVPDLVSTNMLTGTVSVFLGLGGGAYGPARTLPAGAAPSALAVADFDGDGNQDVAVANASAVSLLLGDGRGGLGAPIPAAPGAAITPVALAVGRFDGGALPELAVADARAGRVTILKWDGLARTFVTQAAFLTPRVGGVPVAVTGVAAGPFRGDAARQDLVVTGAPGTKDGAGRLFGAVWVYLNRVSGAPTFGKETNGSIEPNQMITSVRGNPSGVASADFDGDDVADLAVLSSFTATVTILPGLGGAARGSFATSPTQAPLYAGDWGLAVGDLNGDSRPDLATASFVGNTVTVLENIGQGTFRPTREYWAGEHPSSIAIVPSPDGKGSLAVGRTAGNQVSVLANLGRPAPSDGVTVYQDVAYGIDASGRPLVQDPAADFHRLEVFVPPDVRNYPVLVYMHGSPEQVNLSRHASDFLWRSLAAEGIGVVSISVSSSVTADTAMAVAWAHHHIAEYGGNPAQIFGIGHSSGAGSIGAVAGQPQWLQPYGLTPADTFRGVILLDQGGGLPSGNRFPPFLILSGTQGGDATVAQAAALFMANAVRAGAAVQWDIVPGRDHFTLMANAARAGDPARQAIKDFIAARARGDEPTTGVAIVNEDGSRVNIDPNNVAMTYDDICALAWYALEEDDES